MQWMRTSLRWHQANGYKTYEDKPRHEWAIDQCAQMCILVSRIIYTDDVNRMFEKLEEGDDNASKDYFDQTQAQLNNLSDMINGELTKGDRKKIITMVTIDVHGRDVITRLIERLRRRAKRREVIAMPVQLVAVVGKRRGAL